MHRFKGNGTLMAEQGWIKLHRKILEWEWFTDPNTLMVFVYLLCHAQWHDSRFMGHEVKAGQLVTGRKKIAEDLKISEQSVRTSLNHLKSTNEITIKSTNKFSLITIENWAVYQGDDAEANQQINQQANQQLTNNQPTTNHIQEYKNKKKDKINSFNREYEEWYTSLPLEERLKISGVIE